MSIYSWVTFFVATVTFFNLLSPFSMAQEIDSKLTLYAQEKKDAQYYTQLNWIPFGAGSRALGDHSAALVISTADTVSLLSLGGAAAGTLAYVNGESTTGWELIGAMTLLFFSGSAYVFGRMIGTSSAYEYTALHNENLRKELGLTPQQIRKHESRTSTSRISPPLFSYTVDF